MTYWRGAAVTAVLFVIGAASARADVRYVRPDGSGDCTSSSPCAFDTARARAVDGDVLQVAAGEYGLSTDQVFGARVTIEGSRGARPVLNLRSLQLDAPGSVLRDVTVVGSGAQVLRAVSAVIDRVDASNGVSSVPTATVCAFDGPGTLITDTACHANADAFAIALNAWFGGPSGDGDFLLRNVTAISSTSALLAFNPDGHTTTGRVTNSILAGAVGRLATAVTVDHSVITVGVPWDPDTFGASFVGIFGTPPAGLQPVATSPTIDAGSLPASQWDLAGNPRTTGGTTDLGALEWVARAPVATTREASRIGPDTASVFGMVDSGGAPTSYHFEYGRTAGYGSSTPERDAGARTIGIFMPQTLDALAPATTYHYRVVASNAYGTSVGEHRTFTTKARQKPTVVTPKVTISLPSNARCRTSRTQTIRVRIAKGGTIRAAEVRVNRHRRLRVTKAKDLRRSIKVSKLPKGRYRLEVRVLTKDGRTVKASRQYRTCTARR
jgi:hypothetical protein